MRIFKDLDDNEFWLYIWTMAATMFVLLVTTVSWIALEEDQLIHDLIMSGHDPMDIACLYNSSDKLEMPCYVIAQSKADAIKREAEAEK